MHCHRQERTKEISTLKVKAKTFSLIDIKSKFVQICTICATSSQNFLGKGPKSLLPFPNINLFHIQHKLKVATGENRTAFYIAKSEDILFLYENKSIVTFIV